MIAISVIGDPLHQWEKGRKVRVSPWVDLTVDEVHFAKDGDTDAMVVEPKEENGVITAEIPNILLQTTTNIVVYAIRKSDGCEHTLHGCVFSIIPRPKPSDYVYTEIEIKSYEALESRIRYLEENGVSNEQIVSAVSDYLDENPVEVDHPVKFVESPKDNKVCLRDLETGNYVLYGYFKPFPNSSSTLIIDNMLMHLYRSDSGTYMTSIGADGEITVYEILVDETKANGYTYTRKKYNQRETVKEVSEESTDEQIGTAKAVYDLFGTVHNDGDFHITRVESLDESNLKNLLSLDSGVYVLYGYFNPFPGSPTTVPFDNRLVTVEKQTAGSHLFSFNTLNGKVRFFEILVDDTNPYGYTDTIQDINLLTLSSVVRFDDAQDLTDEQKEQARDNIGLSPAKIENELKPVKTVNNIPPDENGNVEIKVASEGGTSFTTDDTLKLENGILRVNTANAAEQDNTLPITSAAVHTQIGNIEVLLQTI